MALSPHLILIRKRWRRQKAAAHQQSLHCVCVCVLKQGGETTLLIRAHDEYSDALRAGGSAGLACRALAPLLSIFNWSPCKLKLWRWRCRSQTTLNTHGMVKSPFTKDKHNFGFPVNLSVERGLEIKPLSLNKVVFSFKNYCLILAYF